MNYDSTKYSIEVSSAHPVTIWYNGHGTTPDREIAYRNVKVNGKNPERGIITFAGNTVEVKRIQETGRWGEWETVTPIQPLSYLKYYEQLHMVE